MIQDYINNALAFIKKADTAYLTSIDSYGFPSTKAVLNLKNSKQFPRLSDFLSKYDSDLTLFFTTNISSFKTGQIINNAKVSVYYCDPKTWHGFRCQGEIELVDDRIIKDKIWHDEWITYYPEGKDSEDFAVFKLIPSCVKRYFELQGAELRQ